MINLRSLAEKYPINNNSEIKFSQETDPNHSFFQQGRELGLLVKTPEGIRIAEEAKSMLELIVDNNTPKYNLKMSYLERKDDEVAGRPREKEYQERQTERQKEIETQALEILTGKKMMNNHEQRFFLKMKDPTWNESLSFDKEQLKQIELAHNYFQTYGMAIDYQNRQDGADSLRIPGSKDSPKNKFANADVLHQKAFKEGWKSVPEIIDLAPSR